MAISLLQDAQQRSLAAALASINREDIDRSLSMSPPMSANTSSSSNAAANAAAAAAMYPGLQQAAAASAFGMLSPQLFAANRQVAAAFMASHLPMPSLASTLFPHHPALFSSWGNPTPHMPLSSGPHSPPASPHSPLSTSHNATASTPASSGKQSLSMISPTACSQSGEMPPKKVRKTLSVKKEFITPSTIEVSMSVADLYHHTPSGPISPPSSGSSPNSTHDGAAGHKDPHKDPARDKSFTCKTCSRSFGYKHVLQNHERTHTGEKPFECPECHKRFTRDHHLKTHMRLHTGEKPYHCSHCDRQFVQVANLRRHLRVHTGERPYTCEICNGKFSDSNQLKSHMLVHNGEKPFACERCHMKFRRRHHLMNHKCGNNNNQHSQSPPTPAISPAMSADYPMCDQKSALGSVYGSEESLDLIAAHHNTTTTKPHYEAKAAAMGGGGNDAPLDLSEDGASSIDGGGGGGRLRKVHDIRRVFRLPPQISHIPTEMPVQTEPEDLSMHSPRSCTSSSAGPPTQLLVESPESLVALHHDDFDLDELDDAATLYMRQQQLAAMKRSMQLE